ncbi:MAG: fumarylacetoacetate hydrolase family protein [Marinilabiliaceae bacterium]|nr:fumarylacetoacetate hydrolase family protein [Marinilabiliaceae bacterium]
MKFICVGLNYAQHIGEMRMSRPEEPVVFMKPESALLRNNNPFFVPEWAQQFDFETEIIVRIDRLGRGIQPKFAHRYYSEIGLGIDFTARDLQKKLMAAGQPWEVAKAFDGSAAVSNFISKDLFANVQNIDFHLDVNGECRQQGNTRDMLFSIDEIIAHVSKYFMLKQGDVIFTGTPAGVGPVKINDRLQGYIEDRLMLDFEVK